MNQPLISVNILSFNRKDDLHLTLQQVFEQDYKNIEVIVVDNNSSDGTVDMVKRDYPAVQLVELKQNIGIAGWNEGFKIAQGEYVLVLDDDSYPEKNAIHYAFQSMLEDNKRAVVAMVVYNQRDKRLEKAPRLSDKIISFTGCGALIRKDKITSIGYFSEDLFLYLHELEFSIRLFNCGYSIYENEQAIVQHIFSNKHRSIDIKNNLDVRRLFYDNRNSIYVLIKYFHLIDIIPRIFRIICGRIYLGFKMNCLRVSLKSILSGLILSYPYLIKPITTSVEVQKLYDRGSFAGGFFFWNNVYHYGNKRPKWLRSVKF